MKYTDGFSSNALIQMRNGLNWIFNKPRSDLVHISNVPFKDKIFEIRSLLGGTGYANARIHCAFVTNGLTTKISDEYKDELKTLLQEYDNGTFQSFEFESIGADELVELLNTQEKKDRSVDADIPIRYDANNPSLIRYHSQGLKGMVCTALASDVASVVNDDATGAVFDANIRRFLGASRAVNSDIAATCSDPSTSYQFWFLNNGITIICDDFDPTTDPDNAHVKIKNLQIINGCQTATALAIAAKNGDLKADTRVLLRIYKTDDPELIDKIVLTTNNQNRISNRDLKANDRVQVDMEEAFCAFDCLYERKVNQYRNQTVPAGKRIVANEVVAQAYLGIALKRPADARGRKYKVWADYYGQIFSGERVEAHVLSVLILENTQNWIKKNNLANSSNDLKRRLAKIGAFHLARMAAFMWRGGDNWSKSATDIKKEIDNLKRNSSLLDVHLKKAMSKLEAIINANAAFLSDIDGALKSNLLEAEINRKLYNP
jgi:hypothetical protein